MKIAVVTVSDRVFQGEREDLSGPLAADLLREYGEVMRISLTSDGAAPVQEAIREALREGAEVVITSGGTGLTSRDQTPEGTAVLMVRRMEGIENLVRINPAVPHAALSRGLAGMVEIDGKTAFVFNAPGSPGGVRDAVHTIGPLLDHIVSQMNDGDHLPEDGSDAPQIHKGSQSHRNFPDSPEGSRNYSAANGHGDFSVDHLSHDLGYSRVDNSEQVVAESKGSESLPLEPDLPVFSSSSLSSHSDATRQIQNRGKNDGSDAAVARAGVSADRISMDALVAAVDDSSAGAVVTFCGQVRNHDNARPVVAIDYEAHPDADAVVATIAREVAASSGACKIAVLHRCGHLEVGDIALGAAVSASHRREAFRVLETIVEQVKMRLPVWKCQEFGDGTKEWTGAA